MDSKYLYFFRGLIAFVAFSDIGTAFKAFIEGKCVLNEISNSKSLTVPRIYGLYSVLQAVVLVHCTLYIHHKPLVSMGLCSLILSITMHICEVSIFNSTAFDFRILFPCALNGMTAFGLLIILFFGFRGNSYECEENVDVLKKSKWFKKHTLNEKLQ